MTLEWSEFAISDRSRIFDYIEADNPQAAVLVDDRIEEGVESLRRFPRKGRPGRINGTRELVIRRTPYIAAYCVIGKAVRVLRILHGAQRWPHDTSSLI